jgi:hypothetical protein
MTANSIVYFVEPEYEPRDIDLAQSAGNKYNGERNQEDALPPSTHLPFTFSAFSLKG